MLQIALSRIAQLIPLTRGVFDEIRGDKTTIPAEVYAYCHPGSVEPLPGEHLLQITNPYEAGPRLHQYYHYYNLTSRVRPGPIQLTLAEDGTLLVFEDDRDKQFNIDFERDDALIKEWNPPFKDGDFVHKVLEFGKHQNVNKTLLIYGFTTGVELAPRLLFLTSEFYPELTGVYGCSATYQRWWGITVPGMKQVFQIPIPQDVMGCYVSDQKIDALKGRLSDLITRRDNQPLALDENLTIIPIKRYANLIIPANW